MAEETKPSLLEGIENYQPPVSRSERKLRRKTFIHADKEHSPSDWRRESVDKLR